MIGLIKDPFPANHEAIIKHVLYDVVENKVEDSEFVEFAKECQTRK